jgi:hypothetical protein
MESDTSGVPSLGLIFGEADGEKEERYPPRSLKGSITPSCLRVTLKKVSHPFVVQPV